MKKQSKDQELAQNRAKLRTIKKMLEEWDSVLPPQFSNIIIKIIESDWNEKIN